MREAGRLRLRENSTPPRAIWTTSFNIFACVNTRFPKLNRFRRYLSKLGLRESLIYAEVFSASPFSLFLFADRPLRENNWWRERHAATLPKRANERTADRYNYRCHELEQQPDAAAFGLSYSPLVFLEMDIAASPIPAWRGLIWPSLPLFPCIKKWIGKSTSQGEPY